MDYKLNVAEMEIYGGNIKIKPFYSIFSQTSCRFPFLSEDAKNNTCYLMIKTTLFCKTIFPQEYWNMWDATMK